jgi:hypothetical protein
MRFMGGCEQTETFLRLFLITGFIMAEEEEVRDLLNSMCSELWKNGLRGDRHRS